MKQSTQNSHMQTVTNSRKPIHTGHHEAQVHAANISNCYTLPRAVCGRS